MSVRCRASGCYFGVFHYIWCTGPVFCLLLGVSSDNAQLITDQVTEVIDQAQPELTPSLDICFWHDTPDTAMMTSSNGNIFRVTGPLCGEFTGPGEFPTQRPVTRSFDVFFHLSLNKRLSKQPWGWWFETPAWSLWRHRNGIVITILRSPLSIARHLPALCHALKNMI